MDLKKKITELMGMAHSIAESCDKDLKDPELVHRYGNIVSNRTFMHGYEQACREILYFMEADEKRKEVKKNGGKKGRNADQGS